MLIGILALVDIVLFAFHRADITKSWLCVYWPGTGREFDWPASLFWGCLICLLGTVVIRFHSVLRASVAVLGSLACLALVLSTTIWLFIKCVWTPWSSVVADAHSLLLRAAPVVLMIFFCSLSEIAISSTKDTDITTWLNTAKPFEFINTWGGSYLYFVKAQEKLFNTVIILANAILVVILTEIIVGSTNPNYDAPVNFYVPLFGWSLLTLKSADAFVTVGTTLVLFGVAELLPKQIAIAWTARALILLCWWIILLGIVFGLFAYGVVGPIQLWSGCLEKCRKRR